MSVSCQVPYVVQMCIRDRYLEDYASPTTRELGLAMISQQLPTIPNERVRAIAQQRLQQIKAGERDFRF